MSRSPFHITYNDLIEHAEHTLRRLEMNNPRLVLQGNLSSHASQKGIEAQRRIVALLKRYKKDPQMDLFAQHEKLK